MIKIEHLHKEYGDKIALLDLNLEIPHGKIFGFLGHNGAGKSTTLKSLTSIIEPTSGKISFDGLDLAKHRTEIKQKIGYVPDSPDIFLQLTAQEYWNLIASIYDIKMTDVQKRLDELVNLFALTDNLVTPIQDMSHGMREKTIIIGTLLVNPDVWILDEPIQGLDPQAAFDLKQVMKAHAEQGKTVIFSTHVLDTAQQLCDEIAILKHGELIFNGSVASLLAAHPNQSLETIYLNMTGSKNNQQEINQLEGDSDAE
ncbi:ABC transporter ATP-binding protein [Fructilactobacillus frigidiflavus]|uniref:ABC transporter ATP-binding protein n=1 Tax=Fructilactobacillus frigidiflavus TaxID=3242688 RepID=UPI0037570487